MRAQDQEQTGAFPAQPRWTPTRAADRAAMSVHPAMPLTSQVIPHLQRAVGNAAVARLVEAQRRRPHSGEEPVQRSSVRDVLRRPGAPLDEATRTDMEARFSTDFSDVRVHTGVEARRSAEEIGATAYTSGSHIVLGAGGTDRHTLAHELTHVVQQRSGPVAGTDNGAGLRVSDPGDQFERQAEANADRVMAMRSPARHVAGGTTTSARTLETEVVQRRFQPFTGPTSWRNTDVTQLHAQGLDSLIELGLTSDNGSTLGNRVVLEQLFSQTGGGSKPGYPSGFVLLVELFAELVGERESERGQVATAMHAINGDFVARANDNPANIFMGTLKANGAHSREVEEPLRGAMQGVTNQGRAVAYQNAMRILGNPTPVPSAPQYVYWAAPGANIPGTHLHVAGATPPVTLPSGATHYVDISAIAQNYRSAPRVVDYSVVPTYVPGHLPDFILETIEVVEDEIADIDQQLAQAQAAGNPPSRLDLWRRGKATDAELGIQILRTSGWQIFPKTFTCSADYWLPTYVPTNPWQVSQDQQTFDAETG